MNKATLLIVTRNRAPQLSVSLQSIIEKDYKDLGILVWDDSSTDNTAEIVAQYNPQINYVKHAKSNAYAKNPGGIINEAHKLCTGSIIFEQGGEVCHVTDCITPLLEICKPGIVAMARVHNGDPQQLEVLKKAIADGRYEFPPDYAPMSIRTNGHTWEVPRVGPEGTPLYVGWERPAPFLFMGAIHADDFDRVGGYDAKLDFNADGDLAKRLWESGVRFVFSGKAIAFHQKHGKS
jgi:GT2 family glycosyltransferase